MPLAVMATSIAIPPLKLMRKSHIHFGFSKQADRRATHLSLLSKMEGEEQFLCIALSARRFTARSHQLPALSGTSMDRATITFLKISLGEHMRRTRPIKSGTAGRRMVCDTGKQSCQTKQFALSERPSHLGCGTQLTLPRCSGLTPPQSDASPLASATGKASSDSIHGPEAWAANPWVAALTFEVHRCNIDKMGGDHE